ncbi:MAG TPA: sialidase family protein [Nannocystaceae bacterium]|nr:sialidase family protein [Nannocystaceae bacterium]
MERRVGLLGVVLAVACAEPAGGGESSGESSTTSASTSTATTASSTSGSASTSSGGSEESGTSVGGSSSGVVDESSTGVVVETMPVFVALGDGGWTAGSCDGGNTWVAHAFSDEEGDHTQWTAFGGLAYRDGAFVAGLGWGGEGGHILRSIDGQSWEDLGMDAFVADGMPVGYAIYTSGVAAIADDLMIFSQRVWQSSDGAAWTSIDVSLPPGAEQLRQLRGFPEANLLVASVESQSGNDHPQGNFVVVSDDGGMTWSEGTGFSSDCANPIQHSGDVELVGDVLLVATGDVCRSPDRGATWELIAMPTGAPINDLFHDDQGFLAVAGAQIWRSTDGASWSMIGDTGEPLRAAAWADGAYAAVSTMGTVLLHSDDAITWSPGTVQDEVPGERWVRDFIGVAVEGDCATR